MDIVQTFYGGLAEQYNQLYQDWDAASREQAEMLRRLFSEYGFGESARILDCACGIGTQAVGLAELGFSVTASDISSPELEQAKARAAERNVRIQFARADFRKLSDVFAEQFDIVIAMDNALPHMLTEAELAQAVRSITARVKSGGIFIASIRDYDLLLEKKPAYAPPYIHKTTAGQRVSLQTWEWDNDIYRLVQYIIEDGETLGVRKYECAYRAVRRAELTQRLTENGCRVQWIFPAETGFFQPVVIAEKL